MKITVLNLYVAAEKKLHNLGIILCLLPFLLSFPLIYSTKSEILIGIAYPLAIILAFVLQSIIRERIEISKLHKSLTANISCEKSSFSLLIEKKLLRLKRLVILDYSSFFLGFICLLVGGFVLESPRIVGVGASWSFIGAMSLIFHLWSQWSTLEIQRKLRG